MPDATSLHHCLNKKQLKLNAFSGKDPAKAAFNIKHTYAVRKVLHLLYGKEVVYTLQSSFCKAGYRPVSVQCLKSTQYSTILMMVLEAVM